MPNRLIEGLARFRRETFPKYREHYRRLVEEGQRPTTLFIGCADSRVVPDLLVSVDPGELFIVRNIGAFVPPYGENPCFDGTAAAIEFALFELDVTDIVVCGHSHCGAIRALYQPPGKEAPHIRKWLELGARARIGRDPVERDPDLDQPAGRQPDAGGPGAGGAGGAGTARPPSPPSRELLFRTEQRSVAVQLTSLMTYPAVRERVDAGRLSLHGWMYVIEDGQVLALDMATRKFAPLAD